MINNKQWNKRQIARLGYLTGRGYGLDAILADPQIGAESIQSLKNVISRWHLPIATEQEISAEWGLHPEEVQRLAEEAAARNIQPAVLITHMLHIIVTENMFGAVLDDRQVRP